MIAAPRRIDVLSPEVIAQIAAGETVERPASVLKELVENSLDAGATRVRVDIEGGLDHLLRVSDDGCGIDAADLAAAFTRHGTSKIARAEDLLAVRTMGFRGEALPSIAQVARVTLTTRTAHAAEGTEVRLDAGRIVQTRPVARAPGTTVVVEDLFWNVPARRKFMKSPATEVRVASRMMSAYAMAALNVAFTLTNDGREMLQLAPTDNLRARVGAVYGHAAAEQLLEIHGEGPGLVVRGVLGTPEIARSSREHQYLFVNDRPVQHPLLAYLVRRAFGTMIPDGRHPFFVILLTVAPDMVDVNVHPTKREVRFARDGDVSHAVMRAAERALRALEPRFEVVAPSAHPFAADRTMAMAAAGLRVVTPDMLPPSERQISLADALYTPAPANVAPYTGESAEAPALSADERPGHGTPFWHLHDTWIFAPVRSGFIILDQHAAHERAAYERIRAQLLETRAPSQELLFPQVMELTAAEYDGLLAIQGTLDQLGFDIRAMSGNTIVVRGIPSDLKAWASGMFLRDLLEDTEEYEASSPALVDALAASYACHSVVRANQPLTTEEMAALVDGLFRTEHPESCPHGRPTFVRIGVDELERRFGRR